MSILSLGEIEETLKSALPQKRQETLRAVADMFLSAAPGLDDTKVEVFDDILSLLLSEAEQPELAELSARMAPIENAPRRIIKRLAGDLDIKIAAPVLERSPRLNAGDLCEIARESSNSHLLVISSRKGLVEPVTDILVTRGDQDVARAVARNQTAKLSDAGIERLLERAERDEAIGKHIKARGDISSDVIKSALAKVTARHAERAKAAHTAEAMVSALNTSGQLQQEQVAAFAKAHRYEETVAAIAVLANFKYELIEGMLYPNRIGGIMLVCKSMAFTWNTVNDVLQMAATCNGLTETEIRQAHREFFDLSRGTADRVVRYWHVRQTVAPIQA